MKKLTFLFFTLTLLTAGTFISCDKVTNALETTIPDLTFDVNINVAEINTKTGSYEFGGSGTIDPSTIPELQPYLALIREVVITEIKITVISVTPATGLELYDATFSLTDLVTSDNFTYSIPSSIPLEVGYEFIIGTSTPNFNVASEIISSLHEATVSAIGHVSQTGFLLGFNYSITANVTVGVPQN